MNFLFISKKLIPILLAFSLVGCQIKSVRFKAPSPTEQELPVQTEELKDTPVSIENLPEHEPKKFGVILGPGALRAYAHIGVLSELSKKKIPIHSIVGIETGALVAAIYAQKEQVFDTEWQMMKLKEEDWLEKGLLVSKGSPKTPESFQEFIQKNFVTRKVEMAQIPFACPSKRLGDPRSQMLSRGDFSTVIPRCLAFPPLFKDANGYIAGAASILDAVQFLKEKGANHIVLVHLLSGATPKTKEQVRDGILWSVVADSYVNLAGLVNTFIPVPVSDIKLTDFRKRSTLIQRGQKAGQLAAMELEKQM